MKKLKQNAFVFLAGAILAIAAIVNANSFTSDFDYYLPSVSEYAIDENGFGDDQLVGTFEHESSVANLENRKASKRQFLRDPRNGRVGGFHEREYGCCFRHFTHPPFHCPRFLKLTFLQEGHCTFPSSDTFRLPKDYYVYTLGRMLC